MKKFILLTALLVASASGARAEFYVGASTGMTASDFAGAAEDFDEDASGWKAYVGWNFAKFLSAEAAYRDIGEFRGNISVEDDEGFATVDAAIIDVSARAFLPIGKLLNLYAKVGYANVQLDGRIDFGEDIANFSDDDWELFYGVGSEFNLGKNFAIRVEWEMFDTDADLNTLSAGLLLRF
jgi:OOP family OmpA-OmpF porin